MSWSVIPSPSQPVSPPRSCVSVSLSFRSAGPRVLIQQLNELKMIVQHLIQRNYHGDIDPTRPFTEQVVELAQHFRDRLTRLVANWLRVGYCQSNFNSDNCAARALPLITVPLVLRTLRPQISALDRRRRTLLVFNQPAAAETNFHMFWTALRPLLSHEESALQQFDIVREGFSDAMDKELERMWTRKLGLSTYDPALLRELLPDGSHQG